MRRNRCNHLTYVHGVREYAYYRCNRRDIAELQVTEGRSQTSTKVSYLHPVLFRWHGSARNQPQALQGIIEHRFCA